MSKLSAFFSSKTIWTQLLGFLAMFAALYGIDIPAEDQSAIVLGIMGIVNVISIFVRYFTNSSMKDKELKI